MIRRKPATKRGFCDKSTIQQPQARTTASTSSRNATTTTKRIDGDNNNEESRNPNEYELGSTYLDELFPMAGDTSREENEPLARWLGSKDEGFEEEAEDEVRELPAIGERLTHHYRWSPTTTTRADPFFEMPPLVEPSRLSLPRRSGTQANMGCFL